MAQRVAHYEVWQARMGRGWVLERGRTFDHLWKAQLCAWKIRRSYPAGSAYRLTQIRERRETAQRTAPETPESTP